MEGTHEDKEVYLRGGISIIQGLECREQSNLNKEDTITNEVKRLGWIREMRIINIIQLSYSHEEIY